MDPTRAAEQGSAGRVEHDATQRPATPERGDTLKPTVSVDTTPKEDFKSDGAPLNALEALHDPDIEAKQRQLVRRLDMTFMPLLWILYFHNYLDRNNIA